MTWAVVVVGFAAVAMGWLLVRSGRGSVWGVMGILYAVLGVLALSLGDVFLSPAVDPAVAAAVGAGAGVVLFAATRVFLLAVRGWGAFQRDAREVYRRQVRLSLPLALLVGAGVAAGEELFWRGLVQARLAEGIEMEAAALVGWLLYVMANVGSGSLSIIAAAVVGGATWAGLAVWSGGVLPGLVCHAVWTGLMLVLPPVRRPVQEASP